MKKLLGVLIILLVFTSPAVFANVNEQVIYAFNQAFPGAEEAKWSKDVYGYFVSFSQNGILSKVAYDLYGDFVYALRYYKQENLPVSIIVAVKKRFKDKNIISVVELSKEDGIEYHIKLEDQKNWYGIVVTDSGSITIEERFKRIDL